MRIFGHSGNVDLVKKPEKDYTGLDIKFEPETNKINIICKEGQEFFLDVEIYTDGELLWKIQNDRILNGRWHKPTKNLLFCKNLKVKLLTDDGSHREVDPYGEENWGENRVVLEKSWIIDTKIDIKEVG
jgi:hypothetical protein